MHLILSLLFSLSAIVHAEQARVPIRDQVTQVWQYLQENVPSRRALNRMPKNDCRYLLASNFYDLRFEVDEALGYMTEGKFNDFISDIVVDKTSRELLQNVLRSMSPDSRDPVINGRFTLAAFLHLARTAGQKDGPMLRGLIEAAVIERSELLKSMVSALVFRFRDRAEDFAEEADLWFADRDRARLFAERQKVLQRASESLRLASSVLESAEIDDPDVFYDLSLSLTKDDSKVGRVRTLIREFNRDTRHRSQKEYLARKREELRRNLNHL